MGLVDLVFSKNLEALKHDEERRELQFQQRWEGLKKKEKKVKYTKRLTHGNKGPPSDHREYMKKALSFDILHSLKT